MARVQQLDAITDQIVEIKKGPQIDPDVILKEELRKTFQIDLTETNVDCDEPEIKDNLKKIAPAQIAALYRILKNDFFDSTDMSIVDIKKQEKCVNQMKNINNMNWQYRILQNNGKETPINDFESMIIFQKMKEI